MSQGAAALEPDSAGTFWELATLSLDVLISAGGDEERVILGPSRCHLFKLAGSGGTRGTCVNIARNGSYLVIAPALWKRNESLSGPALIAPEATRFKGFTAHFFDLRDDGRRPIAFEEPTGERVTLPTGVPEFELRGSQINDDSDEYGPLFGGNSLSLAAEPPAWAQVSVVVVGLEARQPGTWRCEMSPPEAGGILDLSSALPSHQAGWYYVRVYDADFCLLESHDFRLIPQLVAIEREPVPPIPSAAGHSTVAIHVLHTPDLVLRSAGPQPKVTTETMEQEIIIYVPPDPDAEDTRWMAGTEASSAPIRLVVPRVWWSVGHLEITPTSWTDEPTYIAPVLLRPTSTQAIWVRTPFSGWAEQLEAGFQGAQRNRYRFRSLERIAAIPLREFSHVPQLHTVGSHRLSISLEIRRPKTQVTLHAVLVVRLRCRLCDSIYESDDELGQHIRTTHPDDCFGPASYEQLRVLDRQLPIAIYQCSICGFYSKELDQHNSVSQISAHVMAHGQHRFRPVKDVDEIRAKIIQSLPRMRSCKFCSKTFGAREDTKMAGHLISAHWKDLCEIV